MQNVAVHQRSCSKTLETKLSNLLLLLLVPPTTLITIIAQPVHNAISISSLLIADNKHIGLIYFLERNVILFSDLFKWEIKS